MNTEAMIGAHMSVVTAAIETSPLNQALSKRLYDLTPATFPNQ